MWKICTTLLVDNRIKVVFLTSPGNPTGTLIPLTGIQRILDLECWFVIYPHACLISQAQTQAKGDQRSKASLSWMRRTLISRRFRSRPQLSICCRVTTT